MSNKNDSVYQQISEKEDLELATSAPRRKLFQSPVFFALIAMIQSALGVASMAYYGACISTIEKRFQLKSSQSGAIASANDAIGLIILLFVIHYGKSRHRPRIIGALYVTVGLGSLVHIIPHLIYSIPSTLGKNIENSEAQIYEHEFCESTNTSTVQCTEEEIEDSGSLLHQASWLFVGQALASCFSCVYPLFITYLDDGVTKQALAVYMGFYFSTFAIGGALGYALATVCLSLPAYIRNEDYVTSVLSHGDPRWIGAWWLGFLILGVLQVVLALPLFCFPKLLPEVSDDISDDTGGNEYLAARTEELHIEQEVTGLRGFLKGLLKSIWRVVTNPTVLCLIICFIFLSGFISSFPLFGAKYIQFQFGLTPELSAVVFGAVLLPAGVTGNIAGGFLIKRFARTRLQLATILLIISCAFVTVDPLALIFGCQTKEIAGLTVQYPTSDTSYSSPDGLDSFCNEECNCPVAYAPICGLDGITYASPCHAGCTLSAITKLNGNDYVTYSNCSCITQSYTDGEIVPNVTDEVSAVNGECARPCNMLIPYIISYFAIMFLGPMCANPATLLKIRSVDRSDRSMAISVSDITGKLFGFIPGPIYYGAAIDTTCLLFQSSCDRTGNCLVYDIERFRYVFNGITLVLQVLATLSIVACFFTVKLDRKHTRKVIVEPIPMEEKNCN